ncbi:hypothetical protein [Acetobacter sp.]|uniref:hypothetical protein n=1 Tax=Acetobacter sp. TaxID=440 RepID=UPI0039EAC1D0
MTLSDNNAGGTFTPSTVTFPAKNTAEQNVSYTPKSTGTVSISSTNNGSLVDPSGISMVVAAAPIPSTSYTLTTTATGTAGTPRQ